MRLLFTIIIIVIYNITSFTQTESCNCAADFEYVRNKIEKEHPGFKINIKDSGESYYKALVTNILNKIKQSENLTKATCAAYIQEYFSFFKDKHLSVSAEPVQDKSERALDKDLQLSSLDDATFYMRLPTFYKSYWREIDAFYDSIIPQLPERNRLVIDLRNNTGGGERMFEELVQFLKQKNNNPQQIAVVYNRYCASACELFVLEMKKSNKVKTFGENSYGALAYGGIIQNFTPNCKLRFKMPTQKTPKYLPYEGIGIAPDVPLQEGSDWIQAAQELLSAN